MFGTPDSPGGSVHNQDSVIHCFSYLYHHCNSLCSYSEHSYESSGGPFSEVPGPCGFTPLTLTVSLDLDNTPYSR